MLLKESGQKNGSNVPEDEQQTMIFTASLSHGWVLFGQQQTTTADANNPEPFLTLWQGRFGPLKDDGVGCTCKINTYTDGRVQGFEAEHGPKRHTASTTEWGSSDSSTSVPSSKTLSLIPDTIDRPARAAGFEGRFDSVLPPSQFWPCQIYSKSSTGSFFSCVKHIRFEDETPYMSHMMKRSA